MHAIAKSFGILHAYGEYDRFMKMSKKFLKDKGLIQNYNKVPKRKRLRREPPNYNTTQQYVSPVSMAGTASFANNGVRLESPRTVTISGYNDA